jgi:putative PEP-CTERM system TPR-repeat lipoprotein
MPAPSSQTRHHLIQPTVVGCEIATLKPIRAYLCFVFAITLLAMSGCGAEVSSEEHVKRAEAYLAKSDQKSAIIELKNAIRTDAESASARLLLGKILLADGDTAAAEKELRRAQDLGGDINLILPELAEALLMQGKHEDVLSLSRDKLDTSPTVRLISTQARAATALARNEIARSLIDYALELQPSSTDAKMAEATLLLAEGDPTGSLFIVQEVLDQDTDRSEAWVLKGDILARQQNLPEARAAYDKAIALEPESLTNRIKRSFVSIQIQDYDAARSDTSYVLEAVPQNPYGNYLQSVLYIKAGNYKEAISYLTVAEAAWKELPMVLFYLGEANLMVGNLEQAETFAARYFQSAPSDPRGIKLLAIIRVQKGEFSEVVGMIEPVIAKNPNDVEALSILANAQMSQGNTDLGIEYLSRVAQMSPGSANAQLRVGTGLLVAGNTEKAEQHLNAALELQPDNEQAEVLIILGLLQDGDYEKAIAASEKYKSKYPDSVGPHNLLGKVYLAAGEQEKAEISFDAALALQPGDPSANFELAQIALTNDDLTTARARYQAVLKDHPDYLSAILQLAFLDARENNEESMVGHLQRALNTHPDALDPKILLARYYLSKGKPDQVTALFISLDDDQKKSPEILQLKAQAQLASHQDESAKYTLEQLIATTPNNANYHYLLATTAARTNDVKLMRSELLQASTLDPNHLPALLALARLAQHEQNRPELQSYLEKLNELAPDSAEVLRLQAAEAQLNHDTAAALALMTRAFSVAPTNETMVELARLQILSGKIDDANKLQQTWIKNHPEDIQARLAYAASLQAINMPNEAISQYRAMLEIEPNNAIALNNIAWELRHDNAGEALQFINRALEIAPDRPEYVDTLAMIEHLNGDNENASKNILHALAMAPDNPSLLYHKALIDSAAGRTQAAISTLETILAEKAPFPESEQAQEFLDSLKL